MSSGTGRTARLFFAAWPPPEVRAALAARARERAAGRARAVPPGNLHLTLAYLGSLPEERLEAVHATGDAVRAAPATVVLERVEHWVRPRLLCAVPAAGPDPLELLAESLREALADRRLPVESRPFRSHVTLVRKVGLPRSAERLDPPLSWRVARIALVASESTREGVRYREIADWPLREAP